MPLPQGKSYNTRNYMEEEVLDRMDQAVQQLIQAACLTQDQAGPSPTTPWHGEHTPCINA